MRRWIGLALIYKELCLLKAQLKQSFIFVLLIIAGTFYFNYKGLPASYMTFNFPFMISMVLAVQFISASIMVEKKNKTFEMIILAVSVLLMCSTFTVVYIFCNNQSIISIASIGITVCVAILGSVLQTGELDMIYFVLGIVGALVISFVELK